MKLYTHIYIYILYIYHVNTDKKKYVKQIQCDRYWYILKNINSYKHTYIYNVYIHNYIEYNIYNMYILSCSNIIHNNVRSPQQHGGHHFVRLHLRLRHFGHGTQRPRADAEARRDATGGAGCDFVHRAALWSSAERRSSAIIVIVCYYSFSML